MWLYRRMLESFADRPPEQCWGAESSGQGGGGAVQDQAEEAPVFWPSNEEREVQLPPTDDAGKDWGTIHAEVQENIVTEKS